MDKIIGLLVVMMLNGCSFMQPTSAKAPIADAVGAGIYGAMAIGWMATEPSITNTQSNISNSVYTAGIATLSGIALVYVASAIYGFTRDPHSQNWNDPVLGLQILGKAGAAAGAAGQAYDNSIQQNAPVSCFTNCVGNVCQTNCN